jgi:hypothetical protein
MIPKRRLFDNSDPVDFLHFCYAHLSISYTKRIKH